jgi:MFS family permease
MVTAERPGFLSAWSYPQFRLLWVSSLFTYIGRWIETIVGAWIVLEITNSPFLVGLLGTFRFAAMILGPFCGTISDRFNRRRILIAVQLVYAIASFAIMTLFLNSQLEVWHLFGFTLVGGICNTFDFSTRFAATGNVVSDRHLVNAVSLLLVAMGITGILGPLIGGNLLEVIGATGCFAFITASFLASFLALLPLRIPSPDKIEGQESIWQNFVGGLRYVRNDKILFSLIILAALANLCIFPYWFTLIPIFARDILDAGVSGFGYLMAAIGLGGIIGSMVAASLPDSANKGKLTIASIVAWPAILIIFALSRSFYFSLALLVFIGLTQGLAMALIQALLLVRSSAEMRGRVSGARAFAISTLPLGNLLTGAGASFWNAPVMLISNSVFAILLTIFIAIWASTSSPFMQIIRPLSEDEKS